ncbi:MAG: enoyl-CoA hydratase/isomerase family protein, partial [Acidobacteria bacterium]|nr:enoyl-CoA hydratase/isomerase family protein [Acidobacteriota bacterium]
MNPSDDPVFSTREGGVAEIVLNRPARRNAVTGPLAERLHEEILAATEDDEVAVLLLRGAGGA